MIRRLQIFLAKTILPSDCMVIQREGMLHIPSEFLKRIKDSLDKDYLAKKKVGNLPAYERIRGAVAVTSYLIARQDAQEEGSDILAFLEEEEDEEV